jgi:NodT family efflux transporter outer membrane factor (OMF) lipoprotein
MPPSTVRMDAPAAWQAPLPHQGSVTDLSQWWQQQGDPLLVEFIAAAQKISPSVAVSVSRMESARASQVSAGAALMPRVDASVGVSRGVSQPAVPVATMVQGGFQAAWEIDLVGANRAVSHAAVAQWQGSQAQWHDARVAVAAEVAQVYYSLHTCYALLDVVQQDAQSRAQTAHVFARGVQAGLVAPPVAALARASAAEGRSNVTQQSTACAADVQALVALTGLPESDIRQKISPTLYRQNPLLGLVLSAVPAQTIAQRPDVFAAERDVVVASAQVGSAQAQRYPRLTLAGSIGALHSSTQGADSRLDTWSIGPLAINLPIFDAGQRAAQVDLAQTRYAEAVTVYQAKVRYAVREVEGALLSLQSTAARTADANLAAQGYTESWLATQTRAAQGFASLTELEEARRMALAAQTARIALTLERNRAWIALYRAMGGGFNP